MGLICGAVFLMGHSQVHLLGLGSIGVIRNCFLPTFRMSVSQPRCSAYMPVIFLDTYWVEVPESLAWSLGEAPTRVEDMHIRVRTSEKVTGTFVNV